MAFAAENQNSINNIDANKYVNAANNNVNIGNLKVSDEEIAKLQKWLKEKNLTNDTSLQLGSTGDQVKKLQTWLKENEFYNGEIDGNFSNDTEIAVKAFQKEVGLKEDGQVGNYTLLAMEQWDEYAAAVTSTDSSSKTTESSNTKSSDKVYSSASKSKSYQSKKYQYKAKSTRNYSYSRYRGYTNGMDCWAMSAYISSKLKGQGYTVRTIQYATSMSSRHRSVQVYSNGAWTNYNYKANGYSSIYYATSNSKNGKVIG